MAIHACGRIESNYQQMYTLIKSIRNEPQLSCLPLYSVVLSTCRVSCMRLYIILKVYEVSTYATAIQKFRHRTVCIEDPVWQIRLTALYMYLDRWGSNPSPKRGRSPQFSANVYGGQTAEWIKMPLGTEVSLGPDDIVLDGDQATISPRREQSPLPNFRPCLLWPRSPISATAELLLEFSVINHDFSLATFI